jgi:phage anti-repressor protein
MRQKASVSPNAIERGVEAEPAGHLLHGPAKEIDVTAGKFHINMGPLVTPDRPDLIGVEFIDIRQIVKENALRDMEAPADDTFVVVTADETPTDLFGMLQIDNQPGNRFPVNARGLHEYLEIGRDFSNWIKDRTAKFQLVKGVDYEIGFPDLGNQTGRGGDRRSIEYRLTATASRWLAADVNSEKGRKLIKFLVDVVERVGEMQEATALRIPQNYAEVAEQLRWENARK